MMNLELLPNEILLDIFSYFYGIDLLHAFYDLNYRFNNLLYKQYRSYYFVFNSISKRTFDTICQGHLPFISDQVIALTLDNRENSPEQINLFLTYIPSFNLFTNVRSLTFESINSSEKLMEIIHQCHQLCNLTSLKFFSCILQGERTNQLIVDKIWALPKLTHCVFNIYGRIQDQFCIPQKASSSITYLTILTPNTIILNQLNELFQYTPCLKHFSAMIECYSNKNYIPATFLTLTQLKITIIGDYQVQQMNLFFQSFLNLRYLDINIWSILFDGHRWEYMIHNYLPNLQIFKLRMTGTLAEDRNIEEQIDELINSFRSSFWIDEHRWFVRCFTEDGRIYLYTLSNTFNYHEYTMSDSNLFKSTDPHDDEQKLCNSINNIYKETYFDQIKSFHLRLPNIKYLKIRLPIISDPFWAIIPSLNQLKSLKIYSYVDIFQNQLQALFDLAPNLHSVTISEDQSSSSYMSIFKSKYTSLRNLSLLDYTQDCIHCFNEDECVALTRSSLNVQCKVLSISVTNRENIIYLIENMCNLHLLIVKCKDDKYFKTSPAMENNDELIQWVKDRLPSTCSIARDYDDSWVIRIWF
ncbi:unnamed protein product [Adineta steineri]|uniref:F-box domain-containing protein n=1 Tax=Adineta steineri TaxID=433720 RepID=A0A818USC1_9BILA|nr:unnamed protein product [Adineta steineri]CAF3702276.1 unnamed protein product [Adineta steineri]